MSKDTDAVGFERELNEKGELMAVVEEIPEPVEFHLHDTDVDASTGMVTHQLSDGVLKIDIDRIGPYNWHRSSLEDYGLH